LILLPGIALAQATKEDYAIYSQFLKIVQDSYKTGKVSFVVNETTAYRQKSKDIGINDDINEKVRDIRNYLAGNKNSAGYLTFSFRDFAKTLVTDTAWILLLDEVNRKMKQRFKIANNFAPDLQTNVVDEPICDKFFKHVKTVRQIDRNWARFHKKYGAVSALIELSPITSDGQRAVFYFSTRCGGICGEGDLVFFSKENSEWKFLYKAPLWYN